ncbi:MAG TPA: preprotein translocase subunit SecA [Gemmataceae bacterium]|nr:preprotein translocase subunit SecA [Gemmataceae bacterium]
MLSPTSLPSEKEATASLRVQNVNRFGSVWWNRLKAWFGVPHQRRLAYAALQIPRIRHWEAEFDKLSDDEVRHAGLHLRGRARGGESLDDLLAEVFGLICVSAKRHVGLRPFDVQLAAGVVLHNGALAEVSTGEGKTLIATLPVALNALQGQGAHVTTVNDYLAQRDADWTSRIYTGIGLTVGCLQQRMTDDARKAAYAADITYGTASEFGFDFLRDRLKTKGGAGQSVPFWAAWSSTGMDFKPLDPKVQRSHHYSLVDEADNIFIDEARTPLVISTESRAATEAEAVVYKWADKLAKEMIRDKHFYLDEKKQKVELTDEGRHLVRYSNPPFGQHSHAMDKLHEHVERGIHANFRFRLDQHYMIVDNKIVIIDESTGRPMPDRQWNEGLHQAVEAKEGVPINYKTDHAAQITYQSYFKLYKKLSGMTGTAIQNFWELRRVYKLWVVQVPTNRPSIREVMPDRVFPTEDAKFDAIVEEVKKLKLEGRPVLIGTRSVDKSEKLSKKLLDAGVVHYVLNAKPGNAEREADIIAQAGRAGSVTIATNMAGRGTDILLGGNAESIAWSQLKTHFKHIHEVPPDMLKQMIEQVETAENTKSNNQAVVLAGGLHVIGTERHEAARIDRQLIGRAARQGDPGSCQFFLSLEDEILEGLGQGRQAYLQKLGQEGGNRNWDAYVSEFQNAQRYVEKRHYRQRLDLMNYERQRQEILKDLGADPYVD